MPKMYMNTFQRVQNLNISGEVCILCAKSQSLPLPHKSHEPPLESHIKALQNNQIKNLCNQLFQFYSVIDTVKYILI